MSVIEQLHARRLLPHAAAAAATAPSSSAAEPEPEPAVAMPQAQAVSAAHSHAAAAAAPFSSLNATVITALSLLLCGLVAVLAVHAIVRCAFRVCYGQDDQDEPAADASAPSSASCQAGPARRKRGPRAGLPPWILYSREVELAGCGAGAAECAICLAEFVQGDRVRALPRCNHGFHVRCIDRWLAARQTCPTCRRAPFAAKHSLTEPDSAEAPEAVQLQVHA